MKNYIRDFNSQPEAKRINFVTSEVSTHFAMKGILHYPKKEIGIYYRRSQYANYQVISAFAFDWSVISIHNIMQQCCKYQ